MLSKKEVGYLIKYSFDDYQRILPYENSLNSQSRAENE